MEVKKKKSTAKKSSSTSGRIAVLDKMRKGPSVKKFANTDTKNKSSTGRPQTNLKGFGKFKPRPAAAAATGKETGRNKRKHDDDKQDDNDPSKRLKTEEMKKKDRKKFRRTFKNNFEKAAEMKQIWEKMRRRDVTKAEKEQYINQLFQLIRGSMEEFVFAHDTVRVVECCHQYSPEKCRQIVYDELKDHVVKMSQSKYAKFLVMKLLRYGTKPQRAELMSKFHGNVRKLIRHTEAAEVVEDMYNNYANAEQRTDLIQEFYGSTFSLFKDKNVKTLSDILERQPDKVNTVLGGLSETLTPLADKNVVKHSIVHKVMLEFLQHSSGSVRSDMIEAVRETLMPVIHTPDGTKLAMMCVWHGSTKDRKVIVKSLKTFIKKISEEEHGHRMLMAIFDSVDDTRLVQKALLDELLKNISDISNNRYGRRVLLYLLAPRNSSYFHPDEVKLLALGDTNDQSKKDNTIRHKELLDYVSEPLLKLFIMNEIGHFVKDKSLSQLALAILIHVNADTTEALTLIAEMTAEDYFPAAADDAASEYHIIEHDSGHLFLKRLIKMDKEASEKERPVFCDILMETMPVGSLRSWVKSNRGCFLLVTLIESGLPHVSERVKNEIQQSACMKTLKKATGKGAEVLRKVLEA